MNESFISLMMEAVRTSETSVHFNMSTRRYIPEVSKLKILKLCRLEGNTKMNLKVMACGGVDWLNFTIVRFQVLTAVASIIVIRIALVMESVRTSKTSAYLNETTRRCIPEDCNLHGFALFKAGPSSGLVLAR
jgi:hypothetical protein